MRRLILEEPVSRAAIAARRMGWFSIACAVLAVLYLRSLDDKTVIVVAATLGLAFLAAFSALFLALVAFIRIWREGHRGAVQALMATGLACLVLAWPVVLALRFFEYPVMTDVSTDIIDPPSLARSSSGTPQTVPYLKPLVLELSPEKTFTLVRSLMEKKRWSILEAIPPQAPLQRTRTAPARVSAPGMLRASARTLLLKFTDDITVRIAAYPQGSRIDMRSASRFGPHDLGTNATRIQTFLEELADLAKDN